MADSVTKGHAASVPDSAHSMFQGTPTMEPVVEHFIDGHLECVSMRISESELRYVGGELNFDGIERPPDEWMLMSEPAWS